MNDLATHLRNAATDWDGLPGHDNEEIIHYITCKKAREIADHIEAQEKLIEEMREALGEALSRLDYHDRGMVNADHLLSKSNLNTPERNDE